MACTSLPCSWLPPSFSTPQLNRKKSDLSSCSTHRGECSKVTDVSTLIPSPDELCSLHTELSQAGMPVLLSLLSEFCETYIPLSMSGIIPEPLTILFKKSYLSLSYPDLLNKCEEVYCTYSICPEQAKNIEDKGSVKIKNMVSAAIGHSNCI